MTAKQLQNWGRWTFNITWHGKNLIFHVYKNILLRKACLNLRNTHKTTVQRRRLDKPSLLKQTSQIVAT